MSKFSSSQEPPRLETLGLVKSYGERIVLDDVSLRVEASQGLALLGANGAGKTTLLSLCAGVLRPDAGVVRVCGVEVSERGARRRLGFVPQEPALYDELTGEENVRFFGRLCGLSGRTLTDNARAALEAAGLSESRQRRAFSYSGGMKRRLSVACALVHEPALLVLDEPFVGIDAASRAKLCEWLIEHKRAGVALVLSTHCFDEVKELCERAVVIESGRTERELTTPSDPQVVKAHGRTGHFRPVLGGKS